MIKLGVIGCGGISKTHAQQFDRNGDCMRVAAVCDLDGEKAQRAAALTGAQKWSVDYREILDDVDAVLIALPHHLHHCVGMDCLRTGKHVLMEKPLANHEWECLELNAEAEKQNVTLMTAYCMRFHPLARRLKEIIDSHQYGSCFHLSLWTEQWTRFPEPDSWAHRKATLGGGQLFSHGCHYIDLLLWYLGEPQAGTHTGTNFGTPWMEGEGTSDVSIKFASGAVGYHGGTWGARGTRLKYCFQAHCTEGFLEADFASGKLTLIRNGEEVVLLETTTGKHVENEMAHFLSCIESGQKPETDALGSLQSLRVIWRLYEAEAEHRVANLHGLGLSAS